MIYSLGYAGMTSRDVVSHCDKLNALLVDVRGIPQSRKPGFSRKALTELLGGRYIWMGDTLGNKPPNTTKPQGLAELEAKYAGADKQNVILMCLEHEPGDCHRHFSIGVELAKRDVEVRHIYEDLVITAAELERAIFYKDDDVASTDLEDEWVLP